MTTTLLFALLGVVMYRLAQFCGAASRQAFLMVVAYGFGSIALLHATLFSGHQIAASLSFFSFALLVHFSGNRPNNRKGTLGLWFSGRTARRIGSHHGLYRYCNRLRSCRVCNSVADRVHASKLASCSAVASVSCFWPHIIWLVSEIHSHLPMNT